MIRLFTLLALSCALIFPAFSQGRPPPVGPIDEPGTLRLFPGTELILRIQRKLSEAGLYHGPLDGRVGPLLEDAIRTYQIRHGMTPNGEPSEALVKQLETRGDVDALLKRLDVTRQRNLEAARQSLLSNPLTRHLAEEKPTEKADPFRDPSACFRAPVPACLLQEAVESAKAIAADERRDWALGEILSAQAKTGLTDAAMETVGRIKDLRLILVALSNIAKARGEGGNLDQAFDALSVVPMGKSKLDGLVSLVEAALRQGDQGAARKALEMVLRNVDSLKPLEQVVIKCRLYESLTEHMAFLIVAEKLIAEAQADARKDPNAANALQHVAASFARTGHADKAAGIFIDLETESQKTSVQVAMARSYADAGKIKKALAIANTIETMRYKVVVLGHIALVQNKAGDVSAVDETLTRAIELSQEITLPFARSYAFSRLALTLGRLGRGYEAIELCAKIKDDRLRAETLWTLAAELRRGGSARASAKALTLAEDASAEILSSLSKVWMFAGLALDHHLAKEDDQAKQAFERALSQAEMVRNAWVRARALARLADVLYDMRP